MPAETIVNVALPGQITRTLVDRALATRDASLPADVVALAHHCVFDCLAVAIAGTSDPLISLLIEDALEHGGHPAASVIAKQRRVTAAQAALINGTASHALDYDDVNLAISGHPSAVILPALLAAGEQHDIMGAALITAFIAGYEFACRVGMLVEPDHYERGFHATSTVGVFGAAMASAHLLKLDAVKSSYAVGIAGTQAAGLKAMFGTPCKPFHAGLAAQNGLRAALLARRGMTSRGDILECKQGFAATQSAAYYPEGALGNPDRYFIRDNLFKYHAACYGTHSAIECVRELREKHALNPAHVKSVTVRVEKGADGTCNIANPRTGLEGKFSLRFTVALALAGHATGGLENYADEVVNRPDLIALRNRINVELVAGWPLMKTEVLVECANGRRIGTVFDAGEPSTDLASQGKRLRAKFFALTTPVLGQSRSQTLLAAIDDIEQVRVRDLMKLCQPE